MDSRIARERNTPPEPERGGFDTCSILNARSGRCSEDCKWCAQSAHHKGAKCEVYPLVSTAEAVKAARYVAEKGVRRFSLVTSGRALKEIDEVVELYRAIHAACPELYLCASLGLLGRDDLQKLYDAGVRRYHCNLETAPSFFAELCTTHTTEEKIRVLRDAAAVGMEVCSGGIIGMGETREQREELARTLKELGVKSIPVNILYPIAGTPLAGTPPLSDDDVLDAVATFRRLNPDARIRLAGGRARIKHLERRLLHTGIDAMIVGDMLTTAGSSIDDDFTMIRDEGFSFPE